MNRTRPLIDGRAKPVLHLRARRLRHSDRGGFEKAQSNVARILAART
jgi:hypothetical protein